MKFYSYIVQNYDTKFDVEASISEFSLDKIEAVRVDESLSQVIVSLPIIFHTDLDEKDSNFNLFISKYVDSLIPVISKFIRMKNDFKFISYRQKDSNWFIKDKKELKIRFVFSNVF